MSENPNQSDGPTLEQQHAAHTADALALELGRTLVARIAAEQANIMNGQVIGGLHQQLSAMQAELAALRQAAEAKPPPPPPAAKPRRKR